MTSVDYRRYLPLLQANVEADGECAFEFCIPTNGFTLRWPIYVVLLPRTLFGCLVSLYSIEHRKQTHAGYSTSSTYCLGLLFSYGKCRATTILKIHDPRNCRV